MTGIVVTADDITQALIKDDAQADALDTVFKSCPTLSPATRTSWTAFVAGYRTFSANNKDHSMFALGLPAIGDQVVNYEHELAGWQDIANEQCGGGKKIAPTPGAHDEAGNNNPLNALVKAIPWVVGGIALIAVGPYVLAFLPRPRAPNPRRRR